MSYIVGATPRTSTRRREAKSFYKSPRWRACRRVYLRREPLCHDCQAIGRETLAEEVHHIEPRAARPDLEVSMDNLIGLCKSCHSRRTGREQEEQLTRYVVTGPPGSGKSEWVASRSAPGDLVWDWDEIVSALSNLPKNDRPRELIEPLTAMRDALVAWIRRAKPRRRVFVIASNVNTARRLAKQLDAELVQLGTEINVDAIAA